jgi:hypothetical protein
MHELSMTLKRVEPLQRGVAEAPTPNRRPKGLNFLEKFENTQKGEVLFGSSRGLLRVASRLRRHPSVSLVIWKLKPL